jgi:hypothetical protein
MHDWRMASLRRGWVLGLLSALLACGVQARPIVLEETQKITSPDDDYVLEIGEAVLEGSTLLAPARGNDYGCFISSATLTARGAPRESWRRCPSAR